MIGIKIIVALVLGFLILPGNPVVKQFTKKTIQNKSSVIKVEKSSPSPTPIIIKIQKNTTPTEAVKENQSSVDSTWIYPNSKQTENSGNTFSLQSYDDPGKITDWYKQKIESMGMSAKSFVQTKANDNVLNKLAAASGNKKIDVEIEQKAGEQVVKIKVSLVNSD